MSKLEFVKLYTNEKYEMWTAKSSIGQCYIRHGFEKGNWCASTGVFDYTENVTDFESAEKYVNDFHDTFVAAVATANGYVHLEPGQVVVEIADAEALTEFFNDFCPPAWIFEACERINHAIKEARDE